MFGIETDHFSYSSTEYVQSKNLFISLKVFDVYNVLGHFYNGQLL